MKPEAQRIAIAEACGWKIERVVPERGHIYYTFQHPNPKYSIANRYDFEGEVCWPECLPDYLNDLNACHEMEKAIPSQQVANYDSMLWSLVKRDWNESASMLNIIAGWHATAAQRCEAFLKTLGKWEPSVD